MFGVGDMFRFALVVATALLMSGCAIGPSPFDASAADGSAAALAATAAPDLFPARRSGLGLAAGSTDAAAASAEVAVNASRKAPKGALADRDYSATKLDPELALRLINDYRAAKGLTPLRLDPRLTIAAKMQSRDLAHTDRISHYGSDGSSPWDRVKRAGYNAKIAAENVGTGQASLDEVFKGWTESPGHNRNLLLPAARDMGIALVEDPKTEFKTFWTLVVASSQ